MSNETTTKCGTAPCKGCPFRTENHGKRTKGGFYTKANIRRLWGGVRRGEVMICHATDPNAHETGSPANPKPGQIKEGGERVCLGALALWKREEALLVEAGGFPEYKRHPEARRPPMEREGFLAPITAQTDRAISNALSGEARRGIEWLAPDMSVEVDVP